MNAVDWLLDVLAAGESAVITAGGNSMEPRFSSGDQVRLVPWDGTALQHGDVVFAMVGRQPRIRQVSTHTDTSVALTNAVGTPKGEVPHTSIIARVERA